MSTHSIIIHDLIQARVAGDLAKSIGIRVELRSPPGGAANLGPAVFQEIAEEIERTYSGIVTVMILDCGSDAGLAMAALRHGCRDICVNVPSKVHSKLNAIAAARAAHLHDRPTLTLDLGTVQKSGENDLDSMNLALCNYLAKDLAHE